MTTITATWLFYSILINKWVSKHPVTESHSRATERHLPYGINCHLTQIDARRTWARLPAGRYPIYLDCPEVIKTELMWTMYLNNKSCKSKTWTILTVSFDALGVIVGGGACVSSGTDTAPVDADSATLAMIGLRAAALMQLPCTSTTHVRRLHTWVKTQSHSQASRPAGRRWCPFPWPSARHQFTLRDHEPSALRGVAVYVPAYTGIRCIYPRTNGQIDFVALYNTPEAVIIDSTLEWWLAWFNQSIQSFEFNSGSMAHRNKKPSCCYG